jgi:hypothetical protein
VPGKRIDWTRTKRPKGVGTTSQEITEKEAADDVAALESVRAKQREIDKKKPAAWIRTPNELAIYRERNRSDNLIESRLWALLHSPQLSRFEFEREFSNELELRLFACPAQRVRIALLNEDVSNRVSVSPGRPISFDWVMVKIGSRALEGDVSRSTLAIIADLLNNQNQAKERGNA